MPKLSRKELGAYIEQQQQKLQPLLGRGVTIVFGKHEFEDQLQSIQLARQADMINKPEMREDQETGKMYTPACLQLGFAGGQLFFIIEDIDIYMTMSGISIDTGQYSVLLREAS